MKCILVTGIAFALSTITPLGRLETNIREFHRRLVELRQAIEVLRLQAGKE